MKLDRRRLEAAHIMYAVLRVISWYPVSFGAHLKEFKPAHFDNILKEITPIFHKCFSREYAGELLFDFRMEVLIL